MKWLENNVILITLIVLLLGGLWWQEKSKDQGLEETESLYSLIPQPLNSIQFEGRLLRKTEGHFVYGDTQVQIPKKNISSYLEIFKWVSKLEALENLPATNTPAFELVFNNQRFKFYNPLPQTGNFVLSITENNTEKFYLAASKAEYEGLYKDEVDLKLKSYLIMKNQIQDWGQTLLNLPFFPFEVTQYQRKISSGKVITINIEKQVTDPVAPEVLGYNPTVFQDFSKQLQRLSPAGIYKELPRPSKNWGEILVNDTTQELHSLDGIYYLKKEGSYWQLSEAGINLILKPSKDFWNDRFEWVARSFEALKGLTFDFGKQEIPISINEKSELVFQAQNMNEKQIQGIKEVLCYLSKCRKDYKAIRINSMRENPQYPYEVKFSDQKLLFKIEGPVLKLFDPKSKIEMEYLWSLFREGDLFKNLSL